MTLIATIGVALGLAMDAFAVAIAASIWLRGVSPRQVFRFAFHFGLFQAMMPVIGWALGRTVVEQIAQWDHWIAFGLLSFIGIKAIREALSSSEESRAARGDPTRGWSLIVFSVATSIDALAVGLTFAMLDVVVWFPAAIIGLITAALTTFGMMFGARLGARFGQRVEVLGGVVLIGIGIKILLSHTFFAPAMAAL